MAPPLPGPGEIDRRSLRRRGPEAGAGGAREVDRSKVDASRSGAPWLASAGGEAGGDGGAGLTFAQPSGESPFEEEVFDLGALEGDAGRDLAEGVGGSVQGVVAGSFGGVGDPGEFAFQRGPRPRRDPRFGGSNPG